MEFMNSSRVGLELTVQMRIGKSSLCLHGRGIPELVHFCERSIDWADIHCCPSSRILLICIALLSSYSIHLLLKCAGVVGKSQFRRLHSICYGPQSKTLTLALLLIKGRNRTNRMQGCILLRDFRVVFRSFCCS